jgi:hypothetical protein
MGSPGVGERTIEAPFSVFGACSRQNGPSRFAVVSAAPLLPLLGADDHCSSPLGGHVLDGTIASVEVSPNPRSAMAE